MSEKFWGQASDEQLVHGDANDAIEAVIEACYPDPISDDWQITVVEFRPMKPSSGTRSGWYLEVLLENLDEEYGNPNGDGTQPTEAMLAAEKAFIEAVLAEYNSWTCEPTGESVTVNAVEWCREHRREWLEQKP